MKLVVNRYSLEIIPESTIDEAYIEEVLGLKNSEDKIALVRKNAFGLRCIAYLETSRTASE